MIDVIRAFPGKAWHTELDGDVKRNAMDMAPFKIAQSVRADRAQGMRRAIGATANLQAMPTGSDLAVEVRAIAAEAARRIAEETMSFAHQFYRETIIMELELYDQFLPDDAEIVTAVPYEGTIQNVTAQKGDLRLHAVVPVIKIATDQNFRKQMTRDLNQVSDKLQSLMQTVNTVAPLAAPEVVSTLMPGIIEVNRKVLALNGVNPQTIPKEIIAIIQQRIKDQQQLQAAQQQIATQQQEEEHQMKMATMGNKPAGGTGADAMA
jgi:hypothetical protein